MRGSSRGGRGQSAVDVACIDEEHIVAALALTFALVEEPECAGQRDGIEEVGANRDHHVYSMSLDQLWPISIRSCVHRWPSSPSRNQRDHVDLVRCRTPKSTGS